MPSPSDSAQMMVSRHTLLDMVYILPNPKIEIAFQIALKIGFSVFQTPKVAPIESNKKKLDISRVKDHVKTMGPKNVPA